jgi:hypothetical protein
MPTESSKRLSRKHYFWLQLAQASTGLVGLWLSHRIARWGDDNTSSRNVALVTAALVGASLAAVGRSTQIMVTSAFSDSYRVFRSGHLLACSVVLFAGSAFAASSVVHEPFARLLSYGQITGEEIADVGTMVAVAICTVGAVVTAVGAWDCFQDERHWHRSLHNGN